MNKNRLLKLAQLLEDDAKKKDGIKFNMGTFGISNKTGPLRVDCGTQACAMGLAALSKKFQKNGLGYKSIKTRFGYEISFKWKGKRICGFEAAEKLFGLSVLESRFLFSDSYKPEKDIGAEGELYVAQKIRDFVKIREFGGIGRREDVFFEMVERGIT